MNNILCIYHGNCADGFGAAWAVRHALGSNVEFYPGIYQKEPPDVTGKIVLMVDFSYKKAVIEKMAETAQAILIIDHHKSAAEDLADYCVPANLSLGWLPESGVHAIFESALSGAMLTWCHFHSEDPPELIKHIQDRDLWKFDLPGTREIQANIFSFPYDFEIWDRLMKMNMADLFSEGAAIERKHHKDIAELLELLKRPMKIGGFIVPVASLPYTMVSDAAHKMAERNPFAACYWDTAETRIFGLRSVEGGMDVSEIAKEYGGGGHKHAAGFSVPRGHDLAKA